MHNHPWVLLLGLTVAAIFCLIGLKTRRDIRRGAAEKEATSATKLSPLDALLKECVDCVEDYYDERDWRDITRAGERVCLALRRDEISWAEAWKTLCQIDATIADRPYGFGVNLAKFIGDLMRALFSPLHVVEIIDFVNKAQSRALAEAYIALLYEHNVQADQLALMSFGAEELDKEALEERLARIGKLVKILPLVKLDQLFQCWTEWSRGQRAVLKASGQRKDALDWFVLLAEKKLLPSVKHVLSVEIARLLYEKDEEALYSLMDAYRHNSFMLSIIRRTMSYKNRYSNAGEVIKTMLWSLDY